MSERPTARGVVPELTSVGGLLRLVAVVSLAALVLLVGAVGVLGVVAHYANTWEWFFRLERVASLSVPVALGLLGLSVASWIGVVYEAS